MTKRRNLSDDIHGDRADVRGWHHKAVDDFGWWGQGAAKSGGSHKSYTPCYVTHPALKLPGTEFVIYGGSCHSPVVTDADVYIGFDAGMRLTKRRFPWHAGDEISFPVPDMGVPGDKPEYTRLVDWAHEQVMSGRKLHCGCIGGHGRTGMFLAALVSRFGEADAISYVREHYCKKAVESSVQVEFLAASFGVKPVGGSKDDWVRSSSKSTKGGKGKDVGLLALPAPSASNVLRVNPVRGRGSIWG